MAKLFPWDPWLEIECLKEDMQRLAEESACPFIDNARKLGQFRPVADVIETEEEFLVLIELPGLAREDVSLEVHGNDVAVFGERRPPTDRAGAAFQVMERSYGCFARRFALPVDIDAEGVQASMKAGLLQVQVPKCSRRSKNMHISVVVEE